MILNFIDILIGFLSNNLLFSGETNVKAKP